jgi:hypothetical protein
MEPTPSQPPSSPPQPNEADSANAAPAHPAGQVIAPTGIVVPPESPQPLPSNPAAPQPQAFTGAIVSAETYTNMPQTDSGRRFKRPRLKGPLTLAALAVLLLLGGSAAAYFGYYVPNKPENVLAKSFSNSLAEHEFMTQGTLNATSSGISTKIEYTASANEDTHTADLKLNATISGVNIPLEIISAKGNYYFKIGDLSSLEGIINTMLGSSNPDFTKLEDQINKSISDQWISIDSTLVKEAKLDCLAGFPAPFSQSDITSLKTAYAKNSFATIASHTADTVNGIKAAKYEVNINDDSLSKLNLNQTPYFKNLNSCLNSTGSVNALNLSSVKDGDTTPVTVWVDKSTKRIIKYAGKSTSKDKAKGVEGDVSGTISYGKVNIAAPANSKPVLSLLNELGLSDLISAFGGTGASSTLAADTERKTDINALHGQLEAYYAQNGYYPTLASLNDAAWRAANMKGLDAAALKDPAGTSSAIAAKPAKNVYSYSVTPAACDNGTHGNCTSYSLSATLDDGSAYTKQALNTGAGTPSVLN